MAKKKVAEDAKKVTEEKKKDEEAQFVAEAPIELTIADPLEGQLVIEPKLVSFREKLYNLQQDVAELASAFVSDGYNDNQQYEYVKASQYKNAFRQGLAKNRLFHKIDDVMCQTGTDNLKSDKMALTQYHAKLTIMDVDSDREISYMLWSQGADNLDKGLSKAKTMMLKDFVKSNYLISDNDDDAEASAPSPTKSKPKTKFVTPAGVKEAKKTVIANKEMATDEQKETIKKLIAGIREKSGKPNYGKSTLDALDTLSFASAEVKLTTLEMRGNEYGLEL